MNAELSKKLRWKPGMSMLLLNAPEEYAGQLTPAPEDGTVRIVQEPAESPNDAFDFVLLFVKSAEELLSWSSAAISAAAYDGLLWIAYPKKSSKIKTDISRDHGWEPIKQTGLEGIALVSVDDTWSAMRFRPSELVKSPRVTRANESAPAASAKERIVVVPDDLQAELDKHDAAKAFFEQLAYTHRKEYVRWITDAKRAETRTGRIAKTVERLSQGLKNPFM